MIEIVTGLLLVDIIGIYARTLLVLAEHLTEVGVPLEGIAVVVSVITGVSDVDESGKSIFVGLVGAMLLYVVEVLLISFIETVGGGIARGAEASLTTADIDEQVDVVAGGVAMLLL